MFSALLFLQWQSLRNRFWQRLLRLRNPRYLIGALLGGGYLVLVAGQWLGNTGYRGKSPWSFLPTATWEFVDALALCGLALVVWLIPRERAALVFSEAEIAFLFPAPVRRQTLIHYKLLRSQVAVLFTVFFLTLITRWSGGIGGALLRAAGLWLLLSTINLHLIGSSFARTLLLERGVTHWKRRAAIVAVFAALLAGAFLWSRAELPSLREAAPQSVRGYVDSFGQLGQSRPAVYGLAPFRWVVRPFLNSGDPPAFLAALPLALLMLGLHYLWVIRSDVAFEEASLEVSRQYAARVAVRRESRGMRTGPHKRRRAPFRLSPTGPPAVALLWKNLLSAGQVFSARFALTLLAWSAFLAVGFSHASGPTLWRPVIAGMALVLAGWSVVLGPQVVRQDFRQDLAVADLIKLYPMRGWQVALGELLTPAVILTLLQWIFLLVAAILWDQQPGEDGLPAWQTHASLAVSGAILALPLNFVSLLVPNAAAVLLPAWFATPATPGGSRGIEVIGQRFIFLIGQFLVMALAALPVVLTLFVVNTLASASLLAEPWALPVAAAAAALVCAGEAVAGLLLLGHWFERFDLSRERPS